MDVDRDHLARRVYLNSRSARDRLIVNNSLWFFSFTCVHVCFVWFKLKTIWFHHCNATNNCWLFCRIEPISGKLYNQTNTKWRRFTGLLYSKRSIGQVQANRYLGLSWRLIRNEVQAYAPFGKLGLRAIRLCHTCIRPLTEIQSRTQPFYVQYSYTKWRPRPQGIHGAAGKWDYISHYIIASLNEDHFYKVFEWKVGSGTVFRCSIATSNEDHFHEIFLLLVGSGTTDMTVAELY